MTAISVDENIKILEDLDYAIPCGGLNRPHGCGGKNEAEWIILLKLVCDHMTGDHMFLCDPCKEVFISAPSLICPRDVHQTTPGEAILRVEKIR